jgi:uncharacterized membrane protein
MRAFGHPVHAILVVFPLGLLALTPLADLGFFLGGAAELRAFAYVAQVVGLVLGLFALITGFADFLKLREPSPELTKTALTHGGLAFGTLSLFAVAFAFRGGPDAAVRLPVLLLEGAGAACLALTGWFGGHLVFQHGVGVKPGAAPGVEVPPSSRRPPAAGHTAPL